MVTDTDRERARQFCRRFMRLSNSLAEDEFVAALAEARRGALEEAAQLCERDAARDLRGIILAPELAGKFPDDGDPIAPMLPDNGEVAKVANEVGRWRLHIAARHIRALPAPDQGGAE